MATGHGDCATARPSANAQVSTAAAHINFNPTYLEVTGISSGSSLPTALVGPQWNNGTGTIDYEAGKMSGTLPTGTFDLMTVTFNPKIQTPPGNPTRLSFSFVGPDRMINAAYDQYSTLGATSEATITIQ